MNDRMRPPDELLVSLQERAKELKCLYRIEEILGEYDKPIDQICTEIISAIPEGWQFPDICQAIITINNRSYSSESFQETIWAQKCDIIFDDKIVGEIGVYYTKKKPEADIGPFLKEEARLIKAIADLIGRHLTYLKIRDSYKSTESVPRSTAGIIGKDWQAIIEILKQIDRDLYLRISRKMLNQLCWSGIDKAKTLLLSINPDLYPEDTESRPNENQFDIKPIRKSSADSGSEIFAIAAQHLKETDIHKHIQTWIHEDKLSFLSQVVNQNFTLAAVFDAIHRYFQMSPNDQLVHSPSKWGIQISLIRRLLCNQLQYINIAKNYVDIRDIYQLQKKIIYCSESRGKLGGKGAGLYLTSQIIKKQSLKSSLYGKIRMPKTWFITTDILPYFMHYNNLDEIVEQKYKEINQVRLEYPHIIQMFKDGLYPESIIKGLSLALDDFGDHPLIVRSSSLLEGRTDVTFSGKYKSLILTNRGTKRERLNELMKAISEVYASTFGPDPIEYRAGQGLIDFGEEMGIMIQELVGSSFGKYYLPLYSGMAFSHNEYRWSPHIKRDDGLIRMMVGLGTHLFSQENNDYPVLVSGERPGSAINKTLKEIIHYSQKKVDVINLETKKLEIINIDELLSAEDGKFDSGDIISTFRYNNVNQNVVTFEGLLSRTGFIKQIQNILSLYQEIFEGPVDIEFASDGHDLYLLQFHPHFLSENKLPVPIPKDIPKDMIVFSTDKYISNGFAPNITHIVYIDPDKYMNILGTSESTAIGQAVSRLNDLLPKRQFVLMGPGLWGSPGDLKAGIDIGYSDISNAAVLIGIADKKDDRLIELLFGTHFLQDLIDANIPYLPIYSDDEGTYLNYGFLRSSTNIMAETVPEFANLADTIRLIDVPKNVNGYVLSVIMNSEIDESLGYFAKSPAGEESQEVCKFPVVQKNDEFWRCRFKMAEYIASKIDSARFGVVNLYDFGSTKNATAGPASDINLIVHFRGEPGQLEKLKLWFEAWSLCLAEINFQRTGYTSDGLLDVHYITDEDIAKKTSYASKIGAITDAARPLLMKKPNKS